MYAIQGNTVIPIAAKDIVSLGSIIDNRIDVIEQLVANSYGVSVHHLDIAYKDTPEKLMCCFLLHDLFNYSVGSLAVKYKVYHGFLRNQINEHYKKCLQDECFMAQVTALRDVYLEGNRITNQGIRD